VRSFTGSLGFRLTLASFLVISVFIALGGGIALKFSEDAIKTSLEESSRRISRDLPRTSGINEIADFLMVQKDSKAGSVWLMDRDGNLLYHSDPRYRNQYIGTGKKYGDIKVSLQVALPRSSGAASSTIQFKQIPSTYEEGYGEFQHFGEAKFLTFQVIKEKGWLVGLDEPKDTAASELERIKSYITYAGIISAVLVLAFTWLAIRVIVKPYYKEVEDLNDRLKQANSSLSESNLLLEVSNRKITTLYRISITMQETMSLKDRLDLIISGLQEVLAVDRINIMLPDAQETRLDCRAAFGLGNRPIKEISVPLNSKGGALVTAFKRRDVVRVAAGDHLAPNLRLEEPFSKDAFLRSNAFVIVPMVVKNKAVGIIAVDNKMTRKPISDDMINLIQIFANQAAVAVENARLYEEVKKKRDELERKMDQLAIVNQIGNTMQRMVKRKEMLGFILRGIKEGMDFDKVAVLLLDRQKGVIRGEAGVEVPEARLASLAIPLQREENPVILAVNQGTPASYTSTRESDLLRCLAEDPETTGMKVGMGSVDGALLAAALLPIRVVDDVVGVIVAARTQKEPAIFRQEMELLMHFANTAGLSVERASLYERIHDETGSAGIVDEVTRLFTLKYGKDRTREEMTKAADRKKRLSLAMISVDHFKEYNDLLGIEKGDRVLGEIGHMLNMVLFDGDLAFRYAGAVICCIFPDRPIEEARQAVEKLRRLVEKHPFEKAPDAGAALTISAGLVEFPGPAGVEQPADLYQAATVHLHRAEAEGGNRIIPS
jgi:diguanylate cyclase (GGDEF)-like protein